MVLSQQHSPCWRVPVTLPEAGGPPSPCSHLACPLPGCGESVPRARGRARVCQEGSSAAAPALAPRLAGQVA